MLLRNVSGSAHYLRYLEAAQGFAPRCETAFLHLLSKRDGPRVGMVKDCKDHTTSVLCDLEPATGPVWAFFFICTLLVQTRCTGVAWTRKEAS